MTSTQKNDVRELAEAVGQVLEEAERDGTITFPKPCRSELHGKIKDALRSALSDLTASTPTVDGPEGTVTIHVPEDVAREHVEQFRYKMVTPPTAIIAGLLADALDAALPVTEEVPLTVEIPAEAAAQFVLKFGGKTAYPTLKVVADAVAAALVQREGDEK